MRKLLHVLLGLGVLSFGVSAQQTRVRPGICRAAGSKECYSAVLEEIMPKTALRGVFGYALILRYRPSFSPEVQITIENALGKLKVTEIWVQGKNIYEQLQTGRFDGRSVAAIASKIPNRTKTISATQVKADQWLGSFFASYRESLSGEQKSVSPTSDIYNQIDDGTSYELWYRGKAKYHFERQGGGVEYTADDDDALIRWMKQIYKDVSR